MSYMPRRPTPDETIDMLVDANHRLQAHLLTREDRIQQLEDALRSAKGFMAMVLFTEFKHQGWSKFELENGRKWLAKMDAALSREPSEAPEKEEE